MHMFIPCRKHLQSFKTISAKLSIHFHSISCKKKETKFTKQKKWEKIINVIYQNQMHIFISSRKHLKFQNDRWKTVRGVVLTRYPVSIHFDSICVKKEKVRRNNQNIIPKPHDHFHSMPKISAKFQNNWWKIVRGVAPTRYQLSIHFDSISCKKKKETKFTMKKSEKNNQSIIPKPHAHLHSMLKTAAMFQNNRWKTVREVAPTR